MSEKQTTWSIYW